MFFFRGLRQRNTNDNKKERTKKKVTFNVVVRGLANIGVENNDKL